MRIISWPNTDPAHLLSTLSPERYRSGPKTRYEASGAELPRWSFHPLEIMSFSCRTQSKFYTEFQKLRGGWVATVFADESCTPEPRFGAENGLYLFALTMPARDAYCERPTPNLMVIGVANLSHGSR